MLAQELRNPRDKDRVKGLLSGLAGIVHSAGGKIITTATESGSFDLREAIDEQRVTYFLVNSLRLRESAGVFAKIVLQDLMRLIGERYSAPNSSTRKPVTLIINEFANFAMPQFVDFMDRARGAGVGIVIAHQSRADLRAISPEFQERIEANANTTIVSGVKSSEDADYYAGIIGTRTTKKETIQQEAALLFGHRDTGIRAVREAEEYILHPNAIKDLRQGQVLAITSTIERRWALAAVPVTKPLSNQYCVSMDKYSIVVRQGLQGKGNETYLSLTINQPTKTDVPANNVPPYLGCQL